MQYGKYIRQLLKLMTGKIYVMSIVDYGKRYIMQLVIQKKLNIWNEL